MTPLSTSLVTPIFAKQTDDEPWPEDKVFYLVTADGLFLCRNHSFFRSCVPARRWPGELAHQSARLDLTYPPIPQAMLQQIVGFFHAAWQMFGSEAAVLVAWNQLQERVELIVPTQTVTVCKNAWGDVFPIGVHYEIPADLPPHLNVFCDIHSHGDMEAYTSTTDAEDETFRAGLHIVVGRLDQPAPQFHVAAVVDGTRFKVPVEQICGSYEERDDTFPQDWLRQITVKRYGGFKS